MSTAIQKAQEAARLAADYWMVYEGATGVSADKERAQEAEHSMFKWAALAQAEAAERQAAAMERIAAVLEHTTFQPNDNNSHRVFRTLECPWADTL